MKHLKFAAVLSMLFALTACNRSASVPGTPSSSAPGVSENVPAAAAPVPEVALQAPAPPPPPGGGNAAPEIPPEQLKKIMADIQAKRAASGSTP